MHSEAMTRLDMERDLRSALSQGEFRLVYQPIVDLDNGCANELEALIRWERRGQGMLLPMEFIAVAEETGLIVPIGNWVRHEACRQAQIWQEKFEFDPPLIMNVNLSPAEFSDRGLLQSIDNALLASGLAPSSLRVEVTEGSIARRFDANASTT